jgi:hypothetical protein
MDAFSVPADESPGDGTGPEKISEISKVVVEAASHAPSVYGTSPWWFTSTESVICLHADTERRLAFADPNGRQMLISCGAAVFTARLAFRYLGLVPKVSVLPQPSSPNLIASLGFTDERKPASDYERELFDETARRKNHQGGFDNDRLPVGLISTLSEQAASEGAKLTVMADDGHKATLLAAIGAADAAFALDSGRLKEEATWRALSRGAELDASWGGRPEVLNATSGSPGICTVLATADDDRNDWIRAGQALQRMLVVAANRGVSVAVSAQPLEFDQLRDFISAELVGGDSPQMLLRLGITGRATSIA